MDHKISDKLNQFIADNYPELEDKVKNAFGLNAAKNQNIKQLSLDPKSSIDNNINSLVNVINNPDSSPEEKMKALASYNMIAKRMQETNKDDTIKPEGYDKAPSWYNPLMPLSHEDKFSDKSSKNIDYLTPDSEVDNIKATDPEFEEYFKQKLLLRK